MGFCTRHHLSVVLLLAASTALATDHGLLAVHTTRPPTIDGVADDPVWNDTPAITSRDPVAHIDIELRAAHDGEHLYLLARFPDPTEDRQHKTLVWDPAKARYRTGPEREDTLVLKWNMEPFPADLTLTSDDEYLADLWFWKAQRTDPVGYADDKLQRYTRTAGEHGTPRISKSGQAFYLFRDADAGDSAYELLTYGGRGRDREPKYRNRQPSGSRADIRAKGAWKEGVWTVEFQRKLVTGHGDDLQLVRGGSYEFGVSRYEIAGRDSEPENPASTYGAGEVGPLLQLRIQ
ncbi:MAG TPA: ethylbenzene dehydrogenase-related protein [Deferrisomatales bacterium]|nr:ethylbenzene dehydrogenase-related protein [Deferrisomatales bacterium]